MNTLTTLFTKLNNIQETNAALVAEVENQIQETLNLVFDDWKELQDAITKLENFDKVEYAGKEDGIYSWVRFDGLASMEDSHKPYLERYLSDRGIYAGFEHSVLEQYHGDDNITIQAEHGRDNGVYCGHKLIIAEAEYKDDDGQVDETLRNQLIEKYMEKTGCYPGVYRVTYYGDVYPVNTQVKG